MAKPGMDLPAFVGALLAKQDHEGVWALGETRLRVFQALRKMIEADFQHAWPA